MIYVVMVNDGSGWREYDRSSSKAAALVAARFAALFGAKIKIIKRRR